MTADEMGVEMQASSLTRVPSATPVFSAAPLPCLSLARDTLASLKVPTWKGQAQPAMLERAPARLSPVCQWDAQHKEGDAAIYTRLLASIAMWLRGALPFSFLTIVAMATKI